MHGWGLRQSCHGYLRVPGGMLHVHPAYPLTLQHLIPKLVSGDEFKVSGACLGLMGYNRNSTMRGVVRDDSTREGYL